MKRSASRWAMGLVVVLATVARGQFLDNWDIPAWTGTTYGQPDGNPYMDADGNVWGAYEAINTLTRGLTPLVWTQSQDGDRWCASPGYTGGPQYYPAGRVLTGTANGASPYDRHLGVLTVDPGLDGPYSWYGTITVGSWSYYGAFTVTFGKYTAGGGFAELYHWCGSLASQGSTATLNLGNVPQLQNVFVGPGEQLVVALTAAYWSHMYVQFTGVSPAGIGLTGATLLDWPTWSGGSGNPYTDPLGNTWSAYEAVGSLDWINVGSHSMTWNGTNWTGPVPFAGGPLFTAAGVLSGTRDGTSPLTSYMGVLLSDPKINGRYAWFGTGTVGSWSYYGDFTIRFGKYTADDKWITHYVWSGNLASQNDTRTLDLATVPQLQNVSVGDGERLGIAVGAPYFCHLYFNTNGGDPVGVELLNPTTFNVKGWVGTTYGATTNNPCLDSSGNTWAVYEATNDLTWSSLALLPWGQDVTYGDRWQGNGTLPQYLTNRTLTGYRLGTSPYTKRMGVLTIDPGTDGFYNWYGTATVGSWSYYGNFSIHFGKYDASNSYTEIYCWSGYLSSTPGSTVSLDLRTLPALRNIFIGSGERLAVAVEAPYHAHFYLSMATTDPVGIDLAQAASIPIPFWKGNVNNTTAGNPYVDGDGNVWTLHEGIDNYTWTEIWDSKLSWVLAENRWGGSYSSYPQYSAATYLTGVASGSQRYMGLLMIDPAANGTYAWQGTATVGSWSYCGPFAVLFLKYDSVNNVTTLFTWSDSLSAQGDTKSLDLSTVGALTNISVAGGERLAVLMSPNLFSHMYVWLGGTSLSLKQAEPAVSVTLNVAQGTGTPINRGILGQNWFYGRSDYTSSLTPIATSIRGVAGGLFADCYNWKLNTGIDPRTCDRTLAFLQTIRNGSLQPLVTANVRGTGFSADWGSFSYTDTSIAPLATLAGDWVRYCNYIVRGYTPHASDPYTLNPNAYTPVPRAGYPAMTAADKTILAGMNWTSTGIKLPASAEAVPPKVTYWEIGNEPEVPSNACYYVTDYYNRYIALVSAMRSKDSTIKVGPCITVISPGQSSHPVRPVFQADNTTCPMDFVAYHPYDWMGAYWGTTTFMEYGLRNVKTHQDTFLTNLRNTLNSDGRDNRTVEYILSEWNPMGHQYTGDPQKSMAQALGIVESLFTFAEQRVNQAHLWSPVFDGTSPNCAYRVFEKMKGYLTGELLARYPADNETARRTNIRLYATRGTTTNTRYIWALNFDGASDVAVSLTLNNLGFSPTSVTLWTFSDKDAVFETQLMDVFNLDWTSQTITDFSASNYKLVLPAATVRVLVINP